MNNFTEALVSEILKNIPNNYTDNYDFYRFGPQPVKPLMHRLKQKLKDYLQARNFFQLEMSEIEKKMSKAGSYLSDMNYTYQLLEDQQSKEIMARVMAYHILGHKKVKLPLNTPAFWEDMESMKDLVTDENDAIAIEKRGWQLKRMRLDKIGYPLDMYFNGPGSFITFKLKQYEYKGSVTIKTQPGDIVIDAGGCWGDTALYFASETGDQGKVYSFEFIPSNLEIFRKNLSLNPQVGPRVEIVPHPLWDKSDLTIYYKDRGPGSSVKMEPFSDMEGTTTTLTIDDLVETRNVPKIDLIKMDIEGAEYNSLLGALESIKKFRPKLAISVYHGFDDFIRIPKLIHELNLGYKFYLAHYTIHKEETVLYCTI